MTLYFNDTSIINYQLLNKTSPQLDEADDLARAELLRNSTETLRKYAKNLRNTPKASRQMKNLSLEFPKNAN